jgi:hypothetical protein
LNDGDVHLHERVAGQIGHADATDGALSMTGECVYESAVHPFVKTPKLGEVNVDCSYRFTGKAMGVQHPFEVVHDFSGLSFDRLRQWLGAVFYIGC